MVNTFTFRSPRIRWIKAMLNDIKVLASRRFIPINDEFESVASILWALSIPSPRDNHVKDSISFFHFPSIHSITIMKLQYATFEHIRLNYSANFSIWPFHYSAHKKPTRQQHAPEQLYHKFFSSSAAFPIDGFSVVKCAYDRSVCDETLRTVNISLTIS